METWSTGRDFDVKNIIELSDVVVGAGNSYDNTRSIVLPGKEAASL